MPAPMPLRPTTVRFAQDAMDLVQKAADECGVSMAQFVREAALMRAAAVLPGEVSVERLARSQDED